jgi:hypothetical protein
MVHVIVVVREIGRPKPDYRLKFELPAVPTIGSYISIQRPDHPEPFGEDMIVRQIWWRLRHPQPAIGGSAGEDKTGQTTEIFVECEQAIGPYSNSQWRRRLEEARYRGAKLEQFDVERFPMLNGDPKP